MAEKVLIAQTRNPSRTVLMDARLARALVALGAFKYAVEELPADEPAPATPTGPKKKRTYKRRDMKAEGDG